MKETTQDKTRVAAQNRAYDARQALRKAACEYAAAVLLGNPEVLAAAFDKLDEAAEANTKAKS